MSLYAVCVACGDQYAHHPLLVCYSDRDDVRGHLDALPGWYDALLEKPRRNVGRSGKGHSQPSPLSDRAGSARADIRTVLLDWVAYAARTYASTPPRPGRDAQLAELTDYLDDLEAELLSDDQAAESYVHAVQRLAYDAERTAAPAGQEGVIIAVHQADDCDGGAVWASTLNGKGRCAGCGRRESVAWWHDQNPADPDDLLTDEEAVEYVLITYGQAVTVGTVRTWRHRGLPARRDPARLGRVTTRRGDLADYCTARWQLAATG